LEPS